MPKRRGVITTPHGRLRNWVIGTIAAAITLGSLVAGSEFGNTYAKALHPKLIAWACAVAVVVFGVVATSRLSTALSHFVLGRSVPAAGGGVRVLSAGVGYLFVAFAALDVLAVNIERLLVGAGLAGVVLGIAAQQSLGNVFAGLVLLLARPFGVGDRIRIRSGALGGIFDVSVLEMSLTYVTVQTDDGPLNIPNSAMLAAGVGQLPPGARPPVTAPPVTASPVTAPPVTAPPVTAPPVMAPPAPDGPRPASPAPSSEPC